MSWQRLTLVFLAACVVLPLAPSSSPGAIDAVREAKRKDKPLPRVREMIDWVAAEQQEDGGWAHRLWLPIRYHTQSGNGASKPKVPPQSQDDQRSDQERRSFLPTSFDTAMCGLALLRSGSTLSTGDYQREVRRAADFLYRAVQSSSEKTPTIDNSPTPLTDRIGPRADTFAALIFFLTLRDREMAVQAKLAAAKDQKAPDAGAFAYQAAIDRLLAKTQGTVDDIGRWRAEGLHAPILSHALGCWALELATRSGLEVKPEVLARVEQYAMSAEAEQDDLKMEGKWKKLGRVKRPVWMLNQELDDEEPIAAQTYIMSARLSILYQADLTNRVLLDRERSKSAGRTQTAAEYAKVSSMAAAAARTKAALDAGRETMRKTWTTVHKHDVHPCPAPILFTGEDYLSSLMVVDAMAGGGDVEKWFPPLVQYLMARQDMDGGLKIQERLACKYTGPGEEPCLCTKAGPDLLRRNNKENKEHLDKPLAEFDLEPQCCPMQKAWCAKDRVFITAAGTMMLLADTPYRPAFMGRRSE